MTIPNITTQICIQPDPDSWFTVEDSYIDLGCEGLTISVWWRGKRQNYVCIDKECALALADAIYELFKSENCREALLRAMRSQQQEDN